MNDWKPLELEKDIKLFKYKSINIAYKYYNKKKAQKTILFLYGFGANILMADQFAPFLAKHNYSVLTIDYPGHGYSPKIENISIELITKLVIELLKYLKENKIILIGYSFGGILALDFYKEYYINIEKIVLIHTTYFFKNSLYKKIFFNIFEIFLKRFYNFTIRYIAIPALRDFYFTKKQIQDARNTAMNNDKESVFNMFKMIINKNFTDVLYLINCPTLIIGSYMDILVPSNISKKMNKKIKNCRLKLFKIYGHYSILSGTEEVSRIIDDFLKN